MPCAALLLTSTLLFLPQSSAACADLAGCRQAALAAAERGDFETFHDLAWRTVQKGRPNDPELMLMLARAQSLSGRPGDALVMLRRLVAMGVRTDVRESEDFRRVRALPGWADLDAAIDADVAKPAAAEAVADAKPTPPAPPKAAAPPAARTAKSAAPSSGTPAAGERPAPPAADTPAPAPPVEVAPPAAEAAAADAGEDALALELPGLVPVGLAYDTASRRFVLGDGAANKLMVADEVFRHVNDLIGAASGGFGALSAVEIDGRRGDLWVTSSTESGAAVHKLQLVSGRLLTAIQAGEDAGRTTFGDLAVADSGALLVLDTAGARLFTLRPGSRSFDVPTRLSVTGPVSVASSGLRTYIAYEGGLAVADNGGHAVDVAAAKGVALSGLRRIRWGHGALIAIRGAADGRAELVRIRLGRNGTTATAVQPLDNHVEAAGSALTISRDAAYYVARTGSGPTIRRVPLR